MADVQDTLPEWSSTSASNSPSGATTIGTGLAPNIREVQGVVTRWLSHKGSDIASAATTDLGAVEGLMHDITGTATVTGFGTIRAGIWKILKYEGAAPLIHNATSLILLGGASRTTANGDTQIVISEGSGNWRELAYFEAGVLINQRPALATVQATTSGTAKDFTGIPSWARMIVMTLDRVSTNGTTDLRAVLGDADGFEATGYNGAISTNGSTIANLSASVILATPLVAGANYSGQIVFTMHDSSSNTWTFQGSIARNDSTSKWQVSGSKPLSAALTQVRLTADGTDTFDNGSVNILYL